MGGDGSNGDGALTAGGDWGGPLPGRGSLSKFSGGDGEGVGGGGEGEKNWGTEEVHGWRLEGDVQT